jgi:hypothetical protein
MLDQRWEAMRGELVARDGKALCLGFEDSPGNPLILDAALEIAAGSAEWEVCQDDGLLENAGLPAYGRSIHRYLRHRESGAWLALTAGAPLNGIARFWTDEFPGCPCFNPEGGRVFCRPAGVISWRDFAGVLRGKRWRPELDDAWLAILPPVYRELAADRPGDSLWRHFLLPAMGEGALAAEALYLRLALLHGALEAASDAASRRGTPYLNLDDGHFGVRLSDAGNGLPALWTARVVMQRAGAAVAAGPGGRHFVADATTVPGPFRLPGPLHPIRDEGSLRVRKVGAAVNGEVAVEATLQTSQPLAGTDGFHLEIHFEAGTGVVVLPGEIAAGASPREWLFAGNLPADRAGLLVEGATHSKVDVLLHPKLGPACDLYALGVLGLQLFLETDERPLAAVLDDALLLRDRLPADLRATAMPAAVGDLLREFGGLRMPGPADGLWSETLSCLIRMLGGPGEASYFKSAADGLDDAPAAMLRAPLAELARLLQRARARVFGEEGRNREIREEIQRLIAETRGG